MGLLLALIWDVSPHGLTELPIWDTRRTTCAALRLRLQLARVLGKERRVSRRRARQPAMVEEAERQGDLRSGMTVIESTGGSSGSSLAYVCAPKGYALLDTNRYYCASR